jgi:hypothetical protein
MNSSEKLHAGDIERLERRAHAMIATMAQNHEGADADRRGMDRQRFIAQGQWTGEAPAETQALTLYTRDLTGQGVGYIAQGEVVPDTRGQVELPGPDGQPIKATGQIVRTKAFATDWHEGYVQFDGPIDLFSDKPIRAA